MASKKIGGVAVDRVRRFVLWLIILAIGCNASPPEKATTCGEVPQKIEPIFRQHKASSHIAGYRIITNTCIITSIYDSALLGDTASFFGGPGTLDSQKMELLWSEMEEARTLGVEVNFFGHEVGQRDGKMVMVLWGYEYKQYHQIYGQYKWGRDDIPPN